MIEVIKHLKTLLILSTLLFSALAFADTSEGQIITKALSMGEGKSAPLPNGKWLVKKIRSQSCNMCSRNSWLLENTDLSSEIPYIFITDMSLYASRWGNGSYTPSTNAILVENYNTTSSSLATKLSYAELYDINDFEKLISTENQKGSTIIDIDFEKLKDKETEYSNRNFIFTSSRLLFLKTQFRYQVLIRVNKKFVIKNEIDINKLQEPIKKWNAAITNAALSSYFEKKPTKIGETFINDADSSEALASTTITTDSKKENLSKEQTRLAQLQKEKDDLIALEKSKEAQRIAAENLAKEQARLAQLQKEKDNKKQITENLTTKKKALVFGNNEYKKVNQLQTAVDDSLAISTKLKQQGYQVTLLNNGTRSQMLGAIRQFKQSLTNSDEVVMYYAGHGVQLGQSNFLLPTDIQGESEEQVRDDAIALDRVLSDFDEKEVVFTLAIIDACRDNPFKASGTRSVGGTRGLAPVSTANGEMIIFSAGAGQTALDNLGPNDKVKNGLFTRVLLDEMNNSDESIDRMVRNVRKRVVELAKSVGHNQVPAIYDQAIGEFYFSK